MLHRRLFLMLTTCIFVFSFSQIAAQNETPTLTVNVSGQLTQSVADTAITVLAQTTSSWALKWSPDGTRIAIGRIDGTVQIKDAITGQILISLQTNNLSPDTSTMVILKWSPDSTKLAGADMSNKMYLWNVNNAQPLYSLIGENTSYITNIAWDINSSRVAAVSQFDGELQIWNANTGQLLVQHKSGYLLGLDWYGDYLITGIGNGIISFNANTGEFIRNMGIQDAQVTDVAWSPTGASIATGGSDGKIRIWNANTTQLMLTLSEHDDAVTTINWRSDGQQIISSSYDGTVKIWDAHTGQLIGSIVVGLSTFSAQFSPDGNKIIYGDANNITSVMIAPGAPTPSPTATPTPTSTPLPHGCPCTLFGTTVPANPGNVGASPAVNLGVTFRPTVNGKITGIRFYKLATGYLSQVT